MGRIHRRLGARLRLLAALLLVLAGAAALVLSFTLSPTPDTFMVMTNGHRVRTPADMHAVDYAIFIFRIGGAVAVLVGAYLTYRSLRPDRINESEAGPGNWHDRYEDIPPEAGNPSSRAGINFPV